MQPSIDMNPRISSYADIEGHDGEARAAEPAAAAPKSQEHEHEGGGVAMPTYRERHPHRGAERVDLGEPVDDVMDGLIPVAPEGESPPAPQAPPAPPAGDPPSR